jgi:hypothetical protein
MTKRKFNALTDRRNLRRLSHFMWGRILPAYGTMAKARRPILLAQAFMIVNGEFRSSAHIVPTRDSAVFCFGRQPLEG